MVASSKRGIRIWLFFIYMYYTEHMSKRRLRKACYIFLQRAVFLWWSNISFFIPAFPAAFPRQLLRTSAQWSWTWRWALQQGEPKPWEQEFSIAGQNRAWESFSWTCTCTTTQVQTPAVKQSRLSLSKGRSARFVWQFPAQASSSPEEHGCTQVFVQKPTATQPASFYQLKALHDFVITLRYSRSFAFYQSVQQEPTIKREPLCIEWSFLDIWSAKQCQGDRIHS